MPGYAGKPLSTSKHSYHPPAHQGLDVLYIDADLIAVNKPAGLLSVPGRESDKQDCMISRLQLEYPEALIVHRLDMETSGIILFARHVQCQRELSHLFQTRKIKKQYITIVDGKLAEAQGEINLPLQADWPNRPKQIVDFENGKPSITHFNTLKYYSDLDATRVELTPVTGRSHQLRVHMLAIGHAILGDHLYGSEDVINKAERLLLHATSIHFTQPISGQQLAIKCAEKF